MSLSGPEIPAASGRTEQLVILCHGYGADGADLLSLADYWGPLLPYAAFIAPNGPQRCGTGTGYEWFPISQRDPQALLRGVVGAAPALNRFIDEQLHRHGLDDMRLALVGFSQGTILSLHVGLRRVVAPAAIVGLSGSLVGPELLTAEITCRPPVLLIHGEYDDVLPVSFMHKAVKTLEAAGVPVQWHVSRGLGHSIDQDGVELAGQFLHTGFE